jgi:hypothetical protein
MSPLGFPGDAQREGIRPDCEFEMEGLGGRRLNRPLILGCNHPGLGWAVRSKIFFDGVVDIFLAYVIVLLVLQYQFTERRSDARHDKRTGNDPPAHS